MSLALTDRDLLDAWTASRGMSSAERAEDLVARASSSADRAAVASWPLARRNAALLELRISRWGTALEGLAECPECGAELELTLDLPQLVADPDPPSEVRVPVEAGELRARLPAPADLEAAARIPEPDAAARALAERCLLEAPPHALPLSDEAVAAIGESMADADPAGALVLALDCTECRHRWEETIDLADFVSADAHGDVRRIAGEVHTLASAYGWSEADVLALPVERRRLYVELVEG
jgi:hypothetical protein